MAKKHTYKDIQAQSDAELGKLLREQRERLRALRFDLAAGKVKNVKEVKTVRRSIARVLTALSQRKHAATAK